MIQFWLFHKGFVGNVWPALQATLHKSFLGSFAILSRKSLQGGALELLRQLYRESEANIPSNQDLLGLKGRFPEDLADLVMAEQLE